MVVTTKGKIQFDTDGWQGVIAEEFTFENVWQLAKAIALYIEDTYSQDRPVLIGYDTRFLADRFAYSAAEILTDFGRTVKIVDRDCPTPVLAYSARSLGSAGALMFTASHKSAKYCGIKYIADDASPATPDIIDRIVANLDKVDNSPPSGKNNLKIEYFDPKPDYLKFIYSFLDLDALRGANLKIKFDALYSTSRGYLDTILDYCNVDLESFNQKRDVLFGGKIPEAKAEYLQELSLSVKKDKADLGLATNGDRFGIIDDRGQFVAPNLILSVLACHLHKNKGKAGAIVRSVATTHLLDNLARQYNLNILETPIGFSHIGQKTKETDILIGGEESGDMTVGGYIPTGDGILACMLVAEVVAMEAKPLSQLVEETIATAGGELFSTRLDFEAEEAKQTSILNYYSDGSLVEVAGKKITQVDRTDGIKLYLEGGSWLLLHPAKTESLIQVYIEATSLKEQEEIIASLRSSIDSIK